MVLSGGQRSDADGWFTQDGEEYYLDPDTGVMARNTTIDGHEMNSSGVKVS